METIDRPTQFPPIIYVLFAVVIWSTGGVLIKLTSLDAYQVTFFRSLLAAFTVLAITYRKSGIKIDLFGIATSIIYALLLFLFVWATKKTTAANAIFLQYTAPIYILALGPFVIGERFHFRDLIAVVFCIGGMSLFFVGQLRIDDYQGNIAALLSGVFLGLYILLLRHPRAERLNPAVAVIYGNLLLAVLTLPSGISALSTITVSDAVYVSFLGIVQIGIAYLLFIKGVRGGTRPLDASLVGFIEPLLNPVWVYVFYHEQPSEWALLGGGAIILTVATHAVMQERAKRLSFTE